MYAQYPQSQVKVVEDYTLEVDEITPSSAYNAWGCEFKLKKPEAYPIRTYVDFGLDKDPKEEFKVDPLVPFLELLGSIGPNQQLWMQIMVQAHKKVREPGHLFKKYDAWKEGAQKEVNKILMRDKETKVAGVRDEETGFTKMPSISKGEQEVVEAIERSLTKQAFDAGIRVVYLAEKDFFNGANIGSIIGSFKQFTSENLNGFKMGGPWLNNFEYPWQDYRDIRKNRLSKWVIMAYKRRSFFHPPFDGKPLVLNSEELATLFHFPGAVASTPTLERIPSKKSEAPANLPI
jgi:gas vesicle protein